MSDHDLYEPLSAEPVGNLRPDFVFSQSSLQDYVDCARRFELRYLQQLRWPAIESEPIQTHEDHMRLGERFHHLLHQHIAGVPLEKLTAQLNDPQIEQWWSVYEHWGFKGIPEQRFPELTLSAPLGDFRLLAKFDLLALQPGERAVIVDWKTAPRVPPRDRLERRLQTVVYRYVLARAGAAFNNDQPIAPEQMSMVYWYVNGETQEFPYSTAQFEQDERDLLALMTEASHRDDYPLTNNTRQCAYCTYRSLCDRGIRAGSLEELESDLEAEPVPSSSFSLNLDQIAEIEF
jgi:predicted RecB family nuclease